MDLGLDNPAPREEAPIVDSSLTLRAEGALNGAFRYIRYYFTRIMLRDCVFPSKMSLHM